LNSNAIAADTGDYDFDMDTYEPKTSSTTSAAQRASSPSEQDGSDIIYLYDDDVDISGVDPDALARLTQAPVNANIAKDTPHFQKYKNVRHLCFF